MKIRSITTFCNPGWPMKEEVLYKTGEFLDAARPAYESAGYEVQTCRLATIPFPHLIPSLEIGRLLELTQNLSDRAKSLGYDYVSLGPALPHLPESYDAVPDMIAAADNVFLSGMMTTSGEGISLSAVRSCARIIHQVAGFSADGFINLRFGAAANVPPGGPFFPVAYFNPEMEPENPPGFAIATEAADLAVEAVRVADSLASARSILIHTVESHAEELSRIARDLAGEHGITFGGIDFTLAPFPHQQRSFGAAMEGLGVPATGLHGTLAAAAFLTDALDRAHFQRAGFNGLMLPLLEDAVLAARAAEGTLALKDLLMASAVCGTGLDTLPLPGDLTEGQLASILLDVAALSQRLDKPLIARLMPVPGKSAGDLTAFDFPYFANSRVLKVEAEPLTRFFGGDEVFTLSPRR